MGKEANITRKSVKTPVLLYRLFLKLSLLGVIYAVFEILIGTPIENVSLPVTVSVMGAIAYELAYFIYKSNSTSKNARASTTRGQIFVLFKLVLFFAGVFALIYGSGFCYKGNYLGILLIVAGLFCCQQIHNNRKVFSHLSTFCENAGAGFVLITMNLIYKSVYGDAIGKYWIVTAVICILLYALSEFFFHFFNISKHRGDNVKKKDLWVIRIEQFLRNALIIVIIWLTWSLLVLTGSIKSITEAGLYDKIINILPIAISLVTVSVLIYNNFIKKVKPERLSFNPQPGKDEFRHELIDRYGDKGAAVKAFDYVTAEMNRSTGYTRYNGDDYYVHPIAVAKILMDNTDADESVIAAALLHDCVEDLPACTPEYITKEYGKKISDMVMLVTKSKEKDYSIGANMREYLDKISENTGAALIKIADRMNNNSTMTNRSEGKKLFKTKETKEQYLPFVDKVISNQKSETANLSSGKKTAEGTRNYKFYQDAVKFFSQDIE